jgi:ethanolamine ammonia-lyase small subunit
VSKPDPWSRLASLTPARIALGRAGCGLPIREVLKLALAHARARDAVEAPLDADVLESAFRYLGLDTLRVASAAESHAEYLLRPDRGRRLSARSRAELKPAGTDAAVIVGDGLSATAVQAHAAPLIETLLPALRRSGWSLAPIVIATQARVALGDEIGAALGARVSLMLIGERPGLSAADSLGAYLTYAPKRGRSDAERNCISNIHGGGLSYEQAAAKIVWLMSEMFRRGTSGVTLKDESERGFLQQP